VISVDIAARLKRAGVNWQPQLHDFFAIPDRDLDDRVFVIADMSIDVQRLGREPIVTFNGTAEWSLDYILRREVIWLPTGEQLLDLLGESFLGLQRAGEAWRCTVRAGEAEKSVLAATADDALGLGFLAVNDASGQPDESG
jgi:hypothetical protein